MSEESMNSHFKYLLGINHINDFTPNEQLSYLGQLIDLSLDLNNKGGIKKALSFINSLNINSFTSEQRAILYYFTSNAWNNKYDIDHLNKSDNSHWEWKQDEYEKVILYLRMAINEEGFDKLPPLPRCLIFTNLGNVLDKVGRFIEAIENWQKSLRIDSTFGMALGNLGLGLRNYSFYLYDPGHQGLFLKEARSKLIKAKNYLSKDPQYDFYIQSFEQSLSKIEQILGISTDHTCLTKQFSLGASENENLYRKWCLRFHLFLNPLNDLGDYSIAAQDILTTPNMVTGLDVGPRYQGFFNQMKQEYVSARYLFYDGTHEITPHFSDREVLLYNTLDYPCYSLSIEKVKISFRIAYSILDKVAYFLNEYFELGKNINFVYFRTIWVTENKKCLHPLIQTKHNLPLKGLYWISKDLFDVETEFRDHIEPDAKNLHEIRNHLEHKYFKIHDMIISKPDDSKFPFDDLAYSILRSEFAEKTLRVLQLVRNALIYLSLAIHCEELERANMRNPNEIIVPIFPDFYEDNWKR